MSEDTTMVIEIKDGQVFVNDEKPLPIDELMSQLDADLPPYSESGFDLHMGRLADAFAELETHHSSGAMPNIETALVMSRIEDAAGWLAILVEQSIAGRIEEAE